MRYSSLIITALISTACGTNGARFNSDEPESKTSQSARVVSNTPGAHSARGWVNGVGLFVARSTPDHLVEATLKVIAAWNNAIGRDVLSYKGRLGIERSKSLYDSLEDDSTVLYHELDWMSTTNKAKTTLATTIWENDTDTGESIVRGDIILNGQSYLYQDAMAPALDPARRSQIVDTETVLLHEVGHLLGLDHISEGNDALSVMHPQTRVGPKLSQRALSAGDIANIQALYNP